MSENGDRRRRIPLAVDLLRGPVAARRPPAIADGLPPSWAEPLRYCPSCGRARDERGLLCGYREADDVVVYWWCASCGFEALISPSPPGTTGVLVDVEVVVAEDVE